MWLKSPKFVLDFRLQSRLTVSHLEKGQNICIQLAAWQQLTKNKASQKKHNCFYTKWHTLAARNEQNGLLTGFTVISGKVRCTFALVWLLCSIFLTGCAILTLVFVAVWFWNTSLCLPLFFCNSSIIVNLIQYIMRRRHFLCFTSCSYAIVFYSNWPNVETWPSSLFQYQNLFN